MLLSRRAPRAIAGRSTRREGKKNHPPRAWYAFRPSIKTVLLQHFWFQSAWLVGSLMIKKLIWGVNYLMKWTRIGPVPIAKIEIEPNQVPKWASLWSCRNCRDSVSDLLIHLYLAGKNNVLAPRQDPMADGEKKNHNYSIRKIHTNWSSKSPLCFQETTKLSPIDVLGLSSSRFSDGEQSAPRNIDNDTLDMSKMPYY